jgi:hypothetical protein
MTVLRRYTNIPSLLHILQHRKLTLLDPEKWDDGNDSAGMRAYRDQKGLKSLVALCFTEAAETYHHWHVFAEGAGGACLVFDKEKLLRAFDGQKIKYTKVQYKTLEKLKSEKPSLDNLPFTKRWGYRHEKEFRAIYESKTVDIHFFDADISIDSISKVMLSPWIHESLFNTTKYILRKIEGCQYLNIGQSTLTDNKTWKSAFQSVAVDASRNAAK